jgi:hypothetical protein
MAEKRKPGTLTFMRRALIGRRAGSTPALSPFVSIVFFLALGCGSSNEDAALAPADSGDIAETTPATDDDASAGGSDTGAAAYPAGPYGKTVGSVLADISLAGYSRDETTGLATLATYGEASFATLRAHAIVKYALIHVGGYT